MLQIGVIAGLVAMFCWGIADFLQSIPSKRIGTLKTIFYGNIIGLVLTLIIFLFTYPSLKITLSTLLIISFAGLIEMLAVLFFVRSFEIGEVSVVAPISASYFVVTIALSLIFLGEHLTYMQSFSIFLIFFGILLSSTDIRKLSHLKTVKGVREALAALLMWGIYFFIIGLVKGSVDYLTLFIVSSLANGIFLASYPLLNGVKPNLKEIKNRFGIIFTVNTFFYALAWLAVNYGFSMGLVSIVTPVSSLYPAITVLLASYFFREKLASNQKIGVFLLILGVFLLGF